MNKIFFGIKNYVFIIFVIVLFFASCTFDRFPKKVISLVEDNCLFESETDSCFISLKKLVKFNWDYIYIIDTGFEPDEISKLIQTNCNCSEIPDDHTLVIFVNRGNVVYKEIYDNYALNGTDFSFSDVEIEPGFLRLSRKNMDYYVKKNEATFKGIHYVFFRINS